MYDTIIIEITS